MVRVRGPMSATRCDTWKPRRVPRARVGIWRRVSDAGVLSDELSLARSRKRQSPSSPPPSLANHQHQDRRRPPLYDRPNFASMIISARSRPSRNTRASVRPYLSLQHYRATGRDFQFANRAKSRQSKSWHSETRRVPALFMVLDSPSRPPGPRPIYAAAPAQSRQRVLRPSRPALLALTWSSYSLRRNRALPVLLISR
jgi:hypothetical protein